MEGLLAGRVFPVYLILTLLRRHFGVSQLTFRKPSWLAFVWLACPSLMCGAFPLQGGWEFGKAAMHNSQVGFLLCASDSEFCFLTFYRNERTDRI